MDGPDIPESIEAHKHDPDRRIEELDADTETVLTREQIKEAVMRDG